jgi:transcription initiation factor TFIID subunit 3
MSERLLHHALLRPAVIQILRAQGFSGAKPSVVDTLTDIAAKYIMLLATRSLAHAHTSHVDTEPDNTDVRMAMVDCGILQPAMTSTEEIWTELLRKPIEEIPDRNELQRREAQKREVDDTEEIAAFAKWFRSKAHREITRVAGLLPEDEQEGEAQKKPEDYLALLKKKHSKTGEGSRFAGTVLGKESEMRSIKIDGSMGLPESIEQWQEGVKQRSRKLAGMRQAHEDVVRTVEMEDVG